MKFRPVPQAVKDTFEEILSDDHRIERRQMFGCPCAFVAGNLFAGTHQEHITFRLSDADRAEFLQIPGAGPFEPLEGRTMREYVVAPEAMMDDLPTLKIWFERAFQAALALPAKERKAPKARATKG